MKFDLLKELQSNELYNTAINDIAGDERDIVKNNVETYVKDLSIMLQNFIDNVDLDDKIKEEINTVINESGLVIHVDSQLSGSNG